MNQRTVGTGEKTCISLKRLYEKGHQFLANSGTIECTSENGNDIYRLYQDSEAHTLLLCDGDEVEILQKLSNSVLVENPESFYKVWFSPEEFEIATFSLTPISNEQLSDREVENLWESLEDVLFVEAKDFFNDPDYKDDISLVLASNWYIFEAGTGQETIWTWFNTHHSEGLSHFVG